MFLSSLTFGRMQVLGNSDFHSPIERSTGGRIVISYGLSLRPTGIFDRYPGALKLMGQVIVNRFCTII